MPVTACNRRLSLSSAPPSSDTNAAVSYCELRRKLRRQHDPDFLLRLFDGQVLGIGQADQGVTRDLMLSVCVLLFRVGHCMFCFLSSFCTPETTLAAQRYHRRQQP